VNSATKETPLSVVIEVVFFHNFQESQLLIRLSYLGIKKPKYEQKEKVLSVTSYKLFKLRRNLIIKSKPLISGVYIKKIRCGDLILKCFGKLS